MKRFLILITATFWSLYAGAQVRPFVKVGVDSAPLDGFTKPNLYLEPGFEYDGRHLYSTSYFDYSPFISKGGVPGLGFSVGGSSRNYWVVSKNFGVGGGAYYVKEYMSLWSKYSLFVIAGTTLKTRVGRFEFDYKSAPIDQNHNKAVEVLWEIGHRRIRPTMQWGVSHYTEPSYCMAVCTSHIGAEFKAGVKIMLSKGAN